MEADVNFTIIEVLRMNDGNSVVEAWASFPFGESNEFVAIVRLVFIIEESPAWLEFGSVLHMESPRRVRIRRHKGDRGKTVVLACDPERLDVCPPADDEHVIEWIGGPYDGGYVYGPEVKHYGRTATLDGHLYREVKKTGRKRRFAFVRTCARRPY